MTAPGSPSRRDLLAAAAGLALGLPVGLDAHAADEDGKDLPRPLPTRPLGATGVDVTLFGLGCFPLGGLTDEDAAVQVVLRALDLGCRYLDTAPSYARGKSETRVGKALRARPDVHPFVATKTLARTASEARRELEQSLGRLGRERVDLIQIHSITSADDLARVTSEGGPLEGLEKAREEGLVRFIGATGHGDPELLRHVVAEKRFATLLFPLNCVDPHHASFEKGTLPAAVEQNIGRVAMKVFASGKLVELGIDASDCLRYVYARDIATAVVGCRRIEEVELAARVAAENRPLDPEAEAKLIESTRAHAGRNTEWYKRV